MHVAHPRRGSLVDVKGFRQFLKEQLVGNVPVAVDLRNPIRFALPQSRLLRLLVNLVSAESAPDQHHISNGMFLQQLVKGNKTSPEQFLVGLRAGINHLARRQLPLEN